LCAHAVCLHWHGQVQLFFYHSVTSQKTLIAKVRFVSENIRQHSVHT
jgi:hypothetical protein